MSRLVFILGKSGTGKSTSLRSLTSKEVSVISVLGKELPFKTDIKQFRPNSYEDVIRAVEASKTPMVVLDDAHYLMSLFEFKTASEAGYGKFLRNAQGMVSVFEAMRSKDSDQTFYVMAHTEDNEDGTLTFKSTGKMVSEKYNPNGITNIVLQADYDDDTEEFVFRTKANGKGVKAPIDMFAGEMIPNDLKAVDASIRGFYGDTKPSKGEK